MTLTWERSVKNCDKVQIWPWNSFGNESGFYYCKMGVLMHEESRGSSAWHIFLFLTCLLRMSVGWIWFVLMILTSWGDKAAQCLSPSEGGISKPDHSLNAHFTQIIVWITVRYYVLLRPYFKAATVCKNGRTSFALHCHLPSSRHCHFLSLFMSEV